jgi:hypothetical protein
MPTILELNFANFETRVATTAWELIKFLSQNPSPQQVINFHASERAQARLRKLLEMNKDGVLTEKEERELDEIERLEQIVFKLKVNARKQLQQQTN